MIPRIAKAGRSFKGAYSYYGHDKESVSRERVDWTHTENMLTHDPDKAWKVMAYTALEADRLKEASGHKPTGRKLEKPVFSYSLAWHPEEAPTPEHMRETALKSVKALGLQEHETLIIAHRDEPQKHVHVVINKVHPMTGIAAKLSHSKRTLSEFALNHEREHGKIYCPQREKNAQKRHEGKKTLYRDPSIAKAWEVSDSGKSFRAALLNKGYQLAQGRKRIVVIDPHGQIHNPLRHLEGVRAKDLRQRLEGLDTSTLPDATEAAREVQAKHQADYRQKIHHDQETARCLNKMDDRHFDEKVELSRKFQRSILKKRETLSTEYQLAEQKKQVETLRQKTSVGGLWNKLVRKVSRTDRKLWVAEKNLGNAQWRFNEAIQAVERSRDQAMAELSERQSRERKQTVELLKQRSPSQTRQVQKVREWLMRKERQQGMSRRRTGWSMGR